MIFTGLVYSENAGDVVPLQKNIQVLDSLRGIAAILVTLHHAALPFWGSGSGLIKNSYFLVDFFFVLSGFVLAHGYSGRIKNGRDLRHFLALRFFRLWPLHFVTLSVMALCLWALPKWGFAPMSGQADAGVASFTAMTFLTHAMGTVGSYPLNWPSWSIAAEFMVYAVFGLLCIASFNHKYLRLAGGIVFIIFGLLSLASIRHEFGEAYLLNITQWGIFRAFAGFFLGMLVRDFLHLLPLKHVLKHSSVVEGVALLGCAVALCFLDTSTLWVWGMLPLFTVLIVVFSLQQGAVSQWLCHDILLTLGKWSFSIYLVHLGIAKLMSEFAFPHIWGWAEMQQSILFARPLVATFCTAIYLGLSVALAAVTYTIIEMPAMLWARRCFSVPRDTKQTQQSQKPLYQPAVA